MSLSPEIHPLAAQGFSAQAGLYASTRPSYPQACLGWLQETLGLGPGSVVVEVGAGTGKFTARLIETGAEVIAVEPVAEMRAHLVASFPGVRTTDDTAQKLDLPDRSVDAVVCAQSFHWFSTAETVAEFRRVLKPGGRVGLVWNLRDERVEWVAQISKILAPYGADVPSQAAEDMEPLFVAGGFGPMRKTLVDHGHSGPAEEVVVEGTRTRSFVASLPEVEQTALLDRIRGLVESTPELAGKAEVTYPYLTQMLDFQKLTD